MVTLRTVLFYLLLSVGTLLVLITVGSLIQNSQLWYVQLLNFPRLGVLIALVVCLLLFIPLHRKQRAASWLFGAGLVASIGLQASILYPYTVLATTTVPWATITPTNQQRSFGILVANVLITNRDTDALLRVIRDKDPAFVLTMEVNGWWTERLRVLNDRYPYRMTYPTENAYGMALYAKYPLTDRQVLFLNHDRVPAFLARATLPGHQSFHLLTLHPVAPLPSRYPDNVGEREVALAKAGRMVAGLSGPVLVAGDFNDVGWSYNVTHFARVGRLRDVRHGRGFYNTFDSQCSVIRWPLDHVFVSSGFSVVGMERLPAGGSDHFPFYVQVVLQP